MNRTFLIAIGVLILLAAGAVGFWAYDSGRMTAPAEQTAQPVVPPAATPAAPPAAPGKLTWTFTAVATAGDPMSGPKTVVTLTAENGGKKYEAVHAGNCSVIETSAWRLLANEKTGVICWEPGGGTEIGIFEENGKLVVKTGSIEESTDETDGFRGNFKVVAELN